MIPDIRKLLRLLNQRLRLTKIDRTPIIIPDVHNVRRVLVVKEDVLGPMQNSLYIELGDGTWVSVDEAGDIEKFLRELTKFRPNIALSIREELAIIAPFCVEIGFDLDE